MITTIYYRLAAYFLSYNAKQKKVKPNMLALLVLIALSFVLYGIDVILLFVLIGILAPLCYFIPVAVVSYDT